MILVIIYTVKVNRSLITTQQGYRKGQEISLKAHATYLANRKLKFSLEICLYATIFTPQKNRKKIIKILYDCKLKKKTKQHIKKKT